MEGRPTSGHLRASGSMSPDSGGARFDGAVKRTARRGHGSRSWLTTSFPNPASFILGQACALPSNTQGGSRMRESRTYGSVRGACSNGRPYRDPNSQSLVRHLWLCEHYENAYRSFPIEVAHRVFHISRGRPVEPRPYRRRT